MSHSNDCSASPEADAYRACLAAASTIQLRQSSRSNHILEAIFWVKEKIGYILRSLPDLCIVLHNAVALILFQDRKMSLGFVFN